MKLYDLKDTPRNHGMKPGDYHLVCNPINKLMRCFEAATGKELWAIPCLLLGQHANWTRTGGDTPPGVYRFGEIWRDYETPTTADDTTAYGWYTIDLIDKTGNEDGNNRAGICIHGGGTVLGWLGSWQGYQELIPTLGCIRVRNQDLRDKIVPLKTRSNSVWVTVHQYDI